MKTKMYSVYAIHDIAYPKNILLISFWSPQRIHENFLLFSLFSWFIYHQCQTNIQLHLITPQFPYRTINDLFISLSVDKSPRLSRNPLILISTSIQCKSKSDLDNFILNIEVLWWLKDAFDIQYSLEMWLLLG